MPSTKYIIELTETDRKCLTNIVKKGNSPARTILRANIFLTSDKGNKKHMTTAEIELSALGRQCIDKERIPDLETLRSLLKSWYVDRNNKQRGVEWHFTASDARTKLKHLYPGVNI